MLCRVERRAASGTCRRSHPRRCRRGRELPIVSPTPRKSVCLRGQAPRRCRAARRAPGSASARPDRHRALIRLCPVQPARAPCRSRTRECARDPSGQSSPGCRDLCSFEMKVTAVLKRDNAGLISKRQLARGVHGTDRRDSDTRKDFRNVL